MKMDRSSGREKQRTVSNRDERNLKMEQIGQACKTRLETNWNRLRISFLAQRNSGYRSGITVPVTDKS